MSADELGIHEVDNCRVYVKATHIRQEIPKPLADLSKEELSYAIYRHTGRWPDLRLSKKQLEDILWHKAHVTQNPFDLMREKIMEHIRVNTGNLSLHCDGNCVRHTDEMVAACYVELLQDRIMDLEE